MSSAQTLSFLRPYLSVPIRSRRAAYLHIYAATHDGARGQRRGYAAGAGSSNGEASYNKNDVVSRSDEVASRIHELRTARALEYPRIATDKRAMRVPEFLQLYKDVTPDAPSDREVTLYGRIHSIRRAGSKLVFLDMVGEFERVQGLINFGKLSSPGASASSELESSFGALARLLRRGDHVAVTGRAVRTARGELSLEASALPKLLAPSLAHHPETLTDPEARVTSRHMDLLVNRPAADVLRLRAYVVRGVRDFLHSRGFLEFQTPILAASADGAAARPFVVDTSGGGHGEKKKKPAAEDDDGHDEAAYRHEGEDRLRLRIAPELWLKRLVVGGVDRVFELGPAFRNEGVDSTHNPEFTMCEFYQAYASLDDLMATTEDLVTSLAATAARLRAGPLAALPPLDPPDLLHRIVLARPFRRIEFLPALQHALGLELSDLESPTALKDLSALLCLSPAVSPALARSLLADRPSLPRLLDRLASHFVEPLGTTTTSSSPGGSSEGGPFFIMHHPAALSPLAKSFRCPRTGQLVAARAELHDGSGRELANMYEEENDPFAQRAKLEAQLAVGGGGGAQKEQRRIDESYVAALEAGLPPTGGWGVGVERIVMLLAGTRRIADTLSFGNLRNVVALTSGTTRSGPGAGAAAGSVDQGARGNERGE